MSEADQNELLQNLEALNLLKTKTGMEQEFEQRVKATPRLTIHELNPNKGREYFGKWFYAAQEASCVPSVIMSSHLVLNLPLESNLLRSLYLGSALKNVPDKLDKGLSFRQASNIVDDTPNAGIVLSKYTSHNLAILGNFIERYTRIPHPSLGHEDPITQPEKEILDEVYNNYAIALKNDLDVGKLRLLGVATHRYGLTTNYRERTSHAIVLVGYKITDEKNMDVQIIDPVIGLMWMPLEHVLSSTIPLSDQYTIQKRS